MARRRERLLGTASPRVDVDVGTRARTTDGDGIDDGRVRDETARDDETDDDDDDDERATTNDARDGRAFREGRADARRRRATCRARPLERHSRAASWRLPCPAQPTGSYIRGTQRRRGQLAIADGGGGAPVPRRAALPSGSP